MNNNTNLPVLHIPSNGRKVTDSPGWQNSVGIPSESSNALYVIAQRKTSRGWGCSCRGWIRHRHCKHLKALQLPAGEKPYEVRLA
jgi:hypothetical protein